MHPNHKNSFNFPVTFHNFYFSETAEHILTKHKRKQELNILYQVCVFQANPLKQIPALASDWPRHFLLQIPSKITEQILMRIDRL